MTRKDFEFIASVLRDLRATDAFVGNGEDFRLLAIDHFAESLKETNPRFDSGRFVKACNA